jgi:predicted dehydrogenase
MTSHAIRAGFVGAGTDTRERHIPGFQKCDGVQFVAVADRTGTRRRASR